MQSALNGHPTPLKLTALEPLHETMTAERRGECPFLGRLALATRALRPWLAQAIRGRQDHIHFAPLDEHTLNDIGLTRVDAADWGPDEARPG